MNHPSPLEALFFAALEKGSPQERAAYLDEACALDPDLRRRVEKMLAAQAQAGSFLEKPAGSPGETVDDPVRERPGTVIGPYKLLEQIGEGGFGIVFMAEQQQPVRRKVALKVLKPGMDSRQVVARFEAERQALAIMDHPNIAKVLDGGQTASGRPFFVMELVKGVPITDFCDKNHLPVRQRLELFLSVCQAVQHAHHKAIIHRDLKPSNVLVSLHDTEPVVKVIDFGVAKALGQELTDKTLFTGIAQMIGTPLYMSPEQAGMSDLDIDTRSDIYSLGVLLYELLTGTTPFEAERLRKAGYEEMRRIICEEEPPRPSARVNTLGLAAATVSANRGSDPRRLSQLFRGELDWIVMKALEKDRNRRYESASAFAADVQRYLNDEPVLACPPSAWYRFRKFTRRNKTALTITSLVLLAVLLVTGTAGWAMQDRAYRRVTTDVRAEQALNESEAQYQQRKLPEALQAARSALDLVADGRGGPAAANRAREWLKDLEMAARLEEMRCHDDDVEKTTITAAFRDYGIDLKALTPADAAARIAARPIRVDLAITLDMEAKFVIENYNYDPEEHKIIPGLGQRWRQIARLADPDPLRNRIRDAHAAPWFRFNDMLREVEAAIDPATTPLATVLLIDQRWRRMEGGRIALYTAVQRHHPSDFEINFHLGTSLWQVGHWDGAIRYLMAAVAVRPQNSLAREALGNALRDKGLVDEAIAQYREAIRLQPDRTSRWNLAKALLQKKDGQQEALAFYRELVRRQPSSAGEHVRLAGALFEVGRTDEALAEYREALRLWADEDSALYSIALELDKKGLVDEAIAALREAIRLAPGKSHYHDSLGDVLRKKGALEEAVKAYGEAIRLCPTRAATHYKRGGTYAQLGRWNQALAAFDRGLHLDTNKDPERWCQAATAYLGAGDAAGYCRTCRELVHRFGDADQPRIAERTVTTCVLLPIVLNAADFDRVRKLAGRAVTGTEKDADYRFFVLARGLAEYRAGHPADAVNWLGRFSPNADGTHRDATAFAALALAYHNMWPASGEAVCTVNAADFDRLQQRAQQAAGTEKESLFRRFMLAKAEESLARAKAIVTRKMPDPTRGRPFGDDWYLWLVAQAFCREAETRLHQQATKKPNDHPGPARPHPQTPEEAAASFRKAIELNPKDANAYNGLGKALLASGKRNEAIDCLQKAVALDAKNPMFHMILGFALYQEGKRDEVIACYGKAIEVDAKCTIAHYNLGVLLAEQKKLDEAIACYRKAIELDPKYASAYNNLGNILHGQKKLDEAIACYRKAIELDPNDATAYFNLGNDRQAVGEMDEAIFCFRKVVALQPQNARAYTTLGIILRTVKEPDEAIACYRKAIALDANIAIAHHGLGAALAGQGKLDEAMACFRKAIELDPKMALAHKGLGQCLVVQGKLDEAIACFRKVIDLAPQDAEAHNDLASILAESADLKVRKPAEAVKLAATAVQLAPGEAEYWSTLGAAHYRAGNWKEAVAALEKRRALGKGFPTYDGFVLAMAHWQLGEKAKAREVFDGIVQSMEANVAEELRPIRTEAAELLGVDERKQ